MLAVNRPAGVKLEMNPKEYISRTTSVNKDGFETLTINTNQASQWPHKISCSHVSVKNKIEESK